MDKNYESTFLAISESIAKVQDTYELFKNILAKIQETINFSAGGLIVFTRSKYSFEAQLELRYLMEDKLNPVKVSEKYSISEYPFNISLSNPGILRTPVSSITNKKEKGGILLKATANKKIKELVHVPLITQKELVGFLFFAFKKENIPDEKSMNFCSKISNIISVILKNSISCEDMLSIDKEREIQLGLINSLVHEKDRAQLFSTLGNDLDKILKLNFMEINIRKINSQERYIVCAVKDNNGIFRLIPSENKDIETIEFLRIVFQNNGLKPYVEFKHNDFEEICERSEYFRKIKKKFNVLSGLFFTYKNNDEYEIMFLFGKDNVSGFLEKEIDFILQLIPQFSFILKNLFSAVEIHALKKKLEQEKNFLLSGNNMMLNSIELIGNSMPIINLKKKINQVAPLNSTVLIQGETGTGKEIVAKVIYNLSERRNKAMVKINCAALPADLIESELFGHEKGSFTGAIDRHIGKFELANEGTIFLDEIGEMPINLQSKLLRVLQEKEFERVGGKNVIKVDTRIITATNRNLENEIERGKFRADLFFRLNVFPVQIPPLRERREDIPLFVDKFIEQYSKATGKPIRFVRDADMDLLMKYDWPGNVRELEHIIERSVITSSGQYMEFYDSTFSNSNKPSFDLSAFKSLEQMERDYIISALKAANGKITGENSASSILKINGKTLNSKMKKLGIRREIIVS